MTDHSSGAPSDAPAAERPETDWLACHVYYHDHLDPLLTEVVAPLVAELRADGLTEEFFFLRYWDGGQHLRFRVLPPNPGARADASALIERRFRDFLLARPSTTVIDPTEYRSAAARIARWEDVPEPAEPRPNNSLEFPPYRRERQRYGYGAAIAAVERHFTESSELALRLLAAGPDPGQRFTAGFSALALTWLSAMDDQNENTDWARMDTEAPFGTTLTADELDQRWWRQRDRLCAMTDQLRTLATAGDTVTGDLADWSRSIRRLNIALSREIAAGRFVPLTRPPLRPSSPPVLDICAHLFCNRIGLSLSEEGYIRALVARAIGETTSTRPSGITKGNVHAVASDSRPLS